MIGGERSLGECCEVELTGLLSFANSVPAMELGVRCYAGMSELTAS